MVYTPQTVECKVVTVTEPIVCPTPTITYPWTPDIKFVGTNGECQITIDVGAGNEIVGLAPNTSQSFIRVDTGSGWVYLDGYVDSTAALQTINTAWEMDVSTDYSVHVEAQIISSCDNTSSGIVSSEYVQYTAPVCPTPIITFPDTPDTSFDADNIAHCRMTVDAGAGEVLDLVYGGISANDGVSSGVMPTITPPLNETSQIQTVELTWQMQASDSAVYATAQLYNACLKSTFVASSPVPYTHIPPEADITAISIDVIPSTCESLCDPSITITWQNVGTATGYFYPGYTVSIDGAAPLEYVSSVEVEMPDGATCTTNDGATGDLLPLANLPAGIYVICPLPN